MGSRQEGVPRYQAPGPHGGALDDQEGASPTPCSQVSGRGRYGETKERDQVPEGFLFFKQRVKCPGGDNVDVGVRGAQKS